MQVLRKDCVSNETCSIIFSDRNRASVALSPDYWCTIAHTQENATWHVIGLDCFLITTENCTWVNYDQKLNRRNKQRVWRSESSSDIRENSTLKYS